MGKYSQNLEDQVIIDYFNGKVGTFCDIGANDGLTLSNTRALVELGWSGVFVEPSPKAFEMLKENYRNFKGVYFYNFLLGDSADPEDYEFWDSGNHITNEDHALVSTAVLDEKQRWGNQPFTKIKIEKAFRWKTFLNRLLIKKFDVISMDIEGMELEWIDHKQKKRQGLLEQINLIDTSLICVEWNGVDWKKKEFDKILSGFKVIYTSPENLIYAR